jgi:hypothetical protein
MSRYHQHLRKSICPTRRDFLLSAGAAVTLASCGKHEPTAYTGPKPTVSIHRIPHYGAEIATQVAGILSEHKVAVRGKHVLLKPNLV